MSGHPMLLRWFGGDYELRAEAETRDCLVDGLHWEISYNLKISFGVGNFEGARKMRLLGHVKFADTLRCLIVFFFFLVVFLALESLLVMRTVSGLSD